MSRNASTRDRLGGRAHEGEVLLESFDVVGRHHVGDEEAGDVAVPPHPGREAVVAQERRPPAPDLHARRIGDRQRGGGGQRDVRQHVTVGVAIVDGDAALPLEIDGLGGDEHQPLVAREHLRQRDARIPA
jgi:hypothetical protein